MKGSNPTTETTEPLNESPSEKEGKSQSQPHQLGGVLSPLNESPSEKEGKFPYLLGFSGGLVSLNESPSEKEGKFKR